RPKLIVKLLQQANPAFVVSGCPWRAVRHRPDESIAELDVAASCRAFPCIESLEVVGEPLESASAVETDGPGGSIEQSSSKSWRIVVHVIESDAFIQERLELARLQLSRCESGRPEVSIERVVGIRVVDA